MKVVIITHHKTGTQLWARIFRDLVNKCNLKSIQIRGKKVEENLSLINDEWDICQFTHGIRDLKYLEALDKKDYRCIHSIRNAANIIVSATNYHKENGEELWLTKKVANYGNISYREKLSSFENYQDQLIWEMNNVSKKNINNMFNLIKLNKSNFKNIDLDYISFDKRMFEFNNLYYFLKLSEYKNINSKPFTLKEWIKIGLNNFLWNMENRKDSIKKTKNLNKHITRESVKALLDNRYKFEEEAKKEFEKVFGKQFFFYTFNEH